MLIPTNSLANIAEESFIDIWASTRACIPGAVFRKEADMILYSTGIRNSRFNGVLDARFTEGNLIERTDLALSHFQDRHLPMTWHLGSLSTPENLGTHLESRGLVLEDVLRGMAVDLANVQKPEEPSGLEIQSVGDSEALRDCISVVAEAYGFAEDARRILLDTYTSLGIGSTHRWALGRLQGLPIATSLLILHKGVAVVWIVGTIPEVRGRGIGTAITHSQLICARDLGYENAVLQSTEMGFPVYKKLGFAQCCEIRAYTWSPHIC